MKTFKTSKKTIQEIRQEHRDRFGYTKLKMKHGKSKRPDFPDLKTTPKYKTSDTVGNGLVVLSGASHPDARQFPIQQVHKQGYTLFTGADDASYAGGKKS